MMTPEDRARLAIDEITDYDTNDGERLSSTAEGWIARCIRAAVSDAVEEGLRRANATADVVIARKVNPATDCLLDAIERAMRSVK